MDIWIYEVYDLKWRENLWRGQFTVFYVMRHAERDRVLVQNVPRTISSNLLSIAQSYTSKSNEGLIFLCVWALMAPKQDNWNLAQIPPDQVHWGFKRTRPKPGKVRNFLWSSRPNFMWKSLFHFLNGLASVFIQSHFCGALNCFSKNVSISSKSSYLPSQWLFL